MAENYFFSFHWGYFPTLILSILVGATLPETNMAPENGWLEYYIVSFWGVKRPIFRGELAVRFRECSSNNRSQDADSSSPGTKMTLH